MKRNAEILDVHFDLTVVRRKQSALNFEHVRLWLPVDVVSVMAEKGLLQGLGAQFTRPRKLRILKRQLRLDLWLAQQAEADKMRE